MAQLGYVVINSKRYPCDEWSNAQRGEPLAISWNEGLIEGMGEPIYKSNKRYYYGHNFDPTSPPYLRLTPLVTSISGFGSSFSTSNPTYYVRTRNPDGTNVLYIFNGPNVWKINRDTNAVIYGPTSRAGVQYGRPVLFEGVWRIPRGDKESAVDATSYLDAVNLIPLNAGTEATELHANTIETNVKARHFQILQSETRAVLARAFAIDAGGQGCNRVELADSPTGFTATPGEVGSEVGDFTYGITDMVQGQGDLIVMKPDGPYKFDPDGNALPIQGFVTRNLNPAFQGFASGANSHGHGPYTYWIHPSGIWLIHGDQMTPVSFESAIDFFSRSFAATEGIDSGVVWTGCIAYGRWLYASRGSQVWQAYINDDGKLTWYGAFNNLGGAGVGVHVGMDDGPTLWIPRTGQTTLLRIDLEADGSSRGPIGDSRGFTSTTGHFRIAGIDFGRPDRTKQLRKLWFNLEGMGGGMTFTPKVKRDTNAEATWVAAMTADGLSELIGTAGTTDTFRELAFGLDASAIPGNTDPRVRSFGLEAHSADIWRAKIPLKVGEDMGSQGIIGSMENLRELQHGQAIEVVAPGRNTSFTAHVYRVNEKTTKFTADAQPEYEVEVQIEAFNIEAGTN